MRSNKSFYKLTFIVLLLVLGVGYAVVSSVGLEIGGTAGTLTTSSDLNVVFSDVDKSNNYIESATFDGTTADFSVKNLSRKGDSTTITYTVKNNETDLNATLDTLAITNTNPTYFGVTAKYADGFTANETLLEPGDTTIVKVTVELIKTPTAVATTNITIGLTASPNESGEVDSEGNIPGGVSVYTLEDVWIFNDLPSIPLNNLSQNILFKSNGETSYNDIFVTHSNDALIIYFEGDRAYSAGSWYSSGYQVVDFGSQPQTVSQEFYDWFTSNAILRGPSTY